MKNGLIFFIFFGMVSHGVGLMAQTPLPAVAKKKSEDTGTCDPVANLGPHDYTMDVGIIANSPTTSGNNQIHQSQPFVMKFTLNIPNKNDQMWSKLGGTSRAYWIGIDGGNLIFQAGAANTDPPPTGDSWFLQVDATDIPTGTDFEVVISSDAPNSGRVYIDNVKVGEASSTSPINTPYYGGGSGTFFVAGDVSNVPAGRPFGVVTPNNTPQGLFWANTTVTGCP